jgi:hypothetical protein
MKWHAALIRRDSNSAQRIIQPKEALFQPRVARREMATLYGEITPSNQGTVRGSRRPCNKHPAAKRHQQRPANVEI